MPGEISRCLIIAEAGVNHNGDPALAYQLVEAAAVAGADIVKFQTFQAGALAGAAAPKAEYQQRQTGKAESQLAMLRKLELSQEMHHKLIGHCALHGIRFLSTPFDFSSIDFLHSLGLSLLKIPSGEITNLPYLRKIGGLGKELILSTGMSTLEEVAAALRILEEAGTARSNVCLLHCTTEYPAPIAEVNLRAMLTMGEAFPGIKGVGYSDHTLGISVPVAAVALGATAIEKHFTLDKSMEGPDHKASLEPDELALMVRSIREVEAALGDGIKEPTASELKNRVVARKSIVASRAVRAGEIFTENNLAVKRPGTGVSPMLWDAVLGTPARRGYAPDEEID
jgi:N-acetylneuraminate synthase